MKYRWYQIDRYSNDDDAHNGVSDMEYVMIGGTSCKQALTGYIISKGDDPAEYTFGKTNVKGTMDVSAVCPQYTTAILTVRVAAHG
jgi:hypothetical protein